MRHIIKKEVELIQDTTFFEYSFKRIRTKYFSQKEKEQIKKVESK